MHGRTSMLSRTEIRLNSCDFQMVQWKKSPPLVYHRIYETGIPPRHPLFDTSTARRSNQHARFGLRRVQTSSVCSATQRKPSQLLGKPTRGLFTGSPALLRLHADVGRLSNSFAACGRIGCRCTLAAARRKFRKLAAQFVLATE